MNKKMQAHPVASWAIAHDTIYNPPEEKDGFSYVVAGFTIGAVFFGFAITYLAVILGVIK